METELSSQPETLHGEATWKPEDLRRYLLALAHNTLEKNFYLEQEKFPKYIVLDSVWHEILDRMRAETARDDHERFAVIGVDEERDKVFISRDFVRARNPRSDLDAMSILREIVHADNRGIPYLIGDIHSHPQYRFRLLGTLLGQDSFSLGDFHSFLYPQESIRNFSVMFLVGPSKTKAIFRCRETELLPSQFDKNLFESIWANREAFTLRPNIAIARRYRLAYYQANPRRDLIRMFP